MTDKHTYQYDIESGSAPDRVIRMVGAGKKVLEIGTGPGSITRHLSGKGRCQVTGIERDDSAIELVEPFCEAVYKADLGDAQWPSLVACESGFDVVLAADVLEHLYEPLETLQRMKTLLSETGSIVVSLPHVGYAGLLAGLILEDFRYRDWGLLDRTHIRFFGIQNIQQLFEQAGLKIVEVDFATRPVEESEFSSEWQQIDASVRQNLLENPFATVYQVVLRAVPEAAMGTAIQLIDQPVAEFSAPTEFTDEPSDPSGRVPAPEGTPSLIAFYLPQYHPIPENDQWWGKGFTEWSNVTKAVPLYQGHYQPHLPADMGFYDLRLRETRHEQEKLAKEYGIDGFCYHYYWFSGKRLLDRPLDDMLADKENDMPFCLCWANENWTRRWDAKEREVLIRQEYREQDDLEFIRSLIPFFRDERYILKNGVPLLIVYRPQHLPDARNSIAVWREHCREQGFADIHVCCALTHGNEDYEKYGFDSGVEFPPHNQTSRDINGLMDFHQPFQGHVVPYHWVAQYFLDKDYHGKDVMRTVFPSWDNTARLDSRAWLALNGTPANYEYWLSETLKKTRATGWGKESFIFINAWNEWAEGCHLEPDRRYGHQFLEATYRAKVGRSKKVGFEDRMLPEMQYAAQRPDGSAIDNLIMENGAIDSLVQEQADERILEVSGQLKLAIEDVQKLTRQIQEIQSSTSWRVSSPIRVVGQIKKALRGNKGD